MTTTPTVGIRLDEDTRRRLEAMGRRRDRKPHYLMRQAIKRFLDHEEAIDTELALTKERWEKYQTTGNTLNHNDVTAWAHSLRHPPEPQ